MGPLKTVKEVAKELNCSAARVRQIEQIALYKCCIGLKKLGYNLTKNEIKLLLSVLNYL